MDAYYQQQQSQTPYFSSGHLRQRGSGIGALVAGIGRVALPFVKRVILPAAKRIGRELLTQAVPELLDVIAKQKTPKQALRQTISKTVRKQIGRGVGGGGGQRNSDRIQKQKKITCLPKCTHNVTRKKRTTPSKTNTTRKRKATTTSVIPAKGSAKRSRLSFFSNVNNDHSDNDDDDNHDY